MADKERAARRAPGAIVRNDGQQASAKAACGLCRAATVEAARLSAPQTAQILRDRSASVVAGTRCFSPCLTFWYFWVKPKVLKKSGGRIPQQLSELPARNSLPPFVTKRWRQKCPQGTYAGSGRRFSLSGHKRLRCFAHPLRAFEPPSALFPSTVQCGVFGALRAT